MARERAPLCAHLCGGPLTELIGTAPHSLLFGALKFHCRGNLEDVTSSRVRLSSPTEATEISARMLSVGLVTLPPIESKCNPYANGNAQKGRWRCM